MCFFGWFWGPPILKGFKWYVGIDRNHRPLGIVQLQASKHGLQKDLQDSICGDSNCDLETSNERCLVSLPLHDISSAFVNLQDFLYIYMLCL